MENVLWDTDNLKPWMIDKLREELKRYRKEESETGGIRNEEGYKVILGILCDNRFDGKMTEKQLRVLEGKDE